MTESEGCTGKYQTEVLLYRPSDSEVTIQLDRGFSTNQIREF